MFEKTNMATVATDHRETQEHASKLPADHVEDGDLALKVLDTHFEPFTKEEEKKVLRKIDLRLALLMLMCNGIQFVDKLVGQVQRLMNVVY
jgi:hypothetical protein